ncbi:MAG: hypothetical protein ABJM33_17665, partial [Roseibium polysiphoniae]
MPFKHHASRRHKIAKSRLRMTNWAETTPTARDLDVLAFKAHGHMACQKSTGYNHRTRAETLIGSWKSVIGERLRSRTLDNQRTESRISVSVLNKMTS